MVRVAALKNAAEEGDTGPDAAGLTPTQQLEHISLRAHEMIRQLYETLTDEILPALSERGIRLLGMDALDPSAQAALARHFRDEILPALTPMAIDSSRPFPLLVLPEPEPRRAPGPGGGRGAPPPRRGPGAGEAAPPGAPARARTARATSSWRTSSGPSCATCFRASRCWRPRPSASPATPRWTSTTRAAATSSRRWRRSCASAGRGTRCGWRSRPGRARTSSPS